ncbi:MAG: hypothetical protein ACRDM0_11020 [Thermoleophilaceae bacterium]
MIIAVEGASAAGKTTWCTRHAPEKTVPETLGLLAAIADDRPLERCEQWQRVNDRRWQAALALERGSGAAVCDTDPFKLHYVWTLWQIGEAPEAEWHYAARLARDSFAARRCGVADVVAVGRLDPAELRRRKDSDPSRSRRRFELHARLAEPLHRWYEAIDSVDRGRVIWELPPRGLADPRLQVGPRAIRDGAELFDVLMRELAARSRPRGRATKPPGTRVRPLSSRPPTCAPRIPTAVRARAAGRARGRRRGVSSPRPSIGMAASWTSAARTAC